VHVVPRFPGIVFNAKILPLHQVPELPVYNFAVQDFFHNPLFFSLNDLGRWSRRGASTWDRIIRGWSQLHHVEDWVKAAH